MELDATPDARDGGGSVVGTRKPAEDALKPVEGAPNPVLRGRSAGWGNGWETPGAAGTDDAVDVEAPMGKNDAKEAPVKVWKVPRDGAWGGGSTIGAEGL